MSRRDREHRRRPQAICLGDAPDVTISELREIDAHLDAEAAELLAKYEAELAADDIAQS